MINSFEWIGIQDLLVNPNVSDPANRDVSHLMQSRPDAYRKRIREQAKKFSPGEVEEVPVIILI
jgi:ubiquitin-conjugating enzyme E2 I